MFKKTDNRLAWSAEYNIEGDYNNKFYGTIGYDGGVGTDFLIADIKNKKMSIPNKTGVDKKISKTLYALNDNGHINDNRQSTVP